MEQKAFNVIDVYDGEMKLGKICLKRGKLKKMKNATATYTIARLDISLLYSC